MMRRSRTLGLLLAAFVVSAIVSTPRPANACDTPVFRYAMYNWTSWPFYVVYAYRGEPAVEDEAVNKKLREMSATEEMRRANLSFASVNLEDDDELKFLPRPVREACEALEKDREPVHLIWTAWGASLGQHRLTVEEVDALADSPVRQKLGKMLGEGPIATFVLLTCEDKKRNAEAEKAVRELIAMARKGQIPLEVVPGTYGALPDLDESDEAPEVEPDASALWGVDVRMLKLARDDPAERWLVRMLLRIEEDLEEIENEPMVFGVYGRARAMEPYVGEGITAENMAYLVSFLGSKCSCQAKQGNPGSDLLMLWDWEATADALAADDPTMAAEYGMPGYEEYGIEPSASGEENKPDEGDDEGTREVLAPEETSNPGQPAVRSRSTFASEPTGAEEPVTPWEEATSVVSTSPEDPAAATGDVRVSRTGPVFPKFPEASASVAAPSEQGEAQATSPVTEWEVPQETHSIVDVLSHRQYWVFGIGIGVAAMVLIGAGVVVAGRSGS